MKPLERIAVRGCDPQTEREEFAARILDLVRGAGYTVEGFRQEHGISLQHNMTRGVEFTREKVAAILRVLKLEGKDAESVWAAYGGPVDDESMPGVLVPAFRRYGLEEVAERTGVGVSTLWTILRGDPHKARAHTRADRHRPPLSTWTKIAQGLGYTPEEARRIWVNDWRAYWNDHEGRNDIGAEVEILLAERERPQHELTRNGSGPLSGMATRKRADFLRRMRMGENVTADDLALFGDALELGDERRGDLRVALWSTRINERAGELELPDWMRKRWHVWRRNLAKRAVQAEAQSGGDPFAAVTERIGYLIQSHERLLEMARAKQEQALAVVPEDTDAEAAAQADFDGDLRDALDDDDGEYDDE